MTPSFRVFFLTVDDDAQWEGRSDPFGFVWDDILWHDLTCLKKSHDTTISIPYETISVR